MSRQFLNVPNKAYIGVPFSAPIAFCKPSTMEPVGIPFTIVWQTYGVGSATPNMSVGVNIEQPGQKVLIDKIRSVYIDNLGNNVPVYVYFASTNYTVACQPNAQGWFNVLTNDLNAFIIGQGFTDNDRGSTTLVTFSNIAPPPYTNIELDQSVALWRASPAIQRGNVIYNSKFAPPALGDQTIQPRLFLDALNTAPVFASRPSGFYYITGLQVVTYALGSLADTAFDVFLESTGPSGILYSFVMACGLNQKIWEPNIAYDFTGANLKLNATETWRLRNTGVFNSGALQMLMTYTYQPQD